jgi:membrane protein implicated in regulation of membrane protease activity
MTWAGFYLICFAVGFVFSLLSFLVGGLDWHLPFHVHIPTHGMPHVHVGTGGHVGHAPAASGHSGSGHQTTIFPLNPVTLAAFLAWFGGTGYLLTRYSSLWVLLELVLASISGLVGAGIVFFFMTKVLMSEDADLDPADFDMVGVLGHISVPVREGGTGELIYSQAGTRRSCGARSENGGAIPKGTEVVVTRYEKGIAYVRLWTEMAGEDAAPADK